MKQYLDLVEHVLEYGVERPDRTKTGTLSVFGYQSRYNLAEGFPLLTTKKLHTRSIIHELLWFLRGATNNKELNEVGVTIWDEWSPENGDLGPIYGKQWRRWGTGILESFETPDGDISTREKTIDQISDVIERIKNDPYSRRLIVSGWNAAEIDKMALPPCHTMFQFYVANGRLSCHLYQRSADIGLGVPFNIASYSLLTMMVAQVTGLEPGEFVHTLGDAHIYLNHIEPLKLQLSREPRSLPKMILNPEVKSVFDFKFEDFNLEGYDPHPHIKMEIAV